MTAPAAGALGQATRPRGPGFVYGALSLVMLLLIAVIALTARQPPPPSIAEFAPQAVDQIKDAPNEQSSRFGSGEGGEGGTADTTTTTTLTAEEAATSTTQAKKVIDVARVRKCVGTPPRQIEDPQSPPCVNYFEGDNGGATWEGVTANEIRIAIPDYEPDTHEPLEAFFNNRFEFYGRRLELVNVKDDFPGGEPEQTRAAAVKVANERNVFATSNASQGGGYHYHRTAAELGVVSVTDRSNFTRAELDRLSPFAWQYVMENSELFAHLGAFGCQRLAGQPARFSDDATLVGDTRKFAVIAQTEQAETPVDPSPLVDALTRCLGEPPLLLTHDHDATGQAPNFVLSLKQNEITTVYCLCQVLFAGEIARSATSNAYYPEWVLSTYHIADTNFTLRTFFPQDHLRNVMGLTSQPRQLKIENNPPRWAVKEADPDNGGGGIGISGYTLNESYRSLLLIAAGIQMAGPKLTPETFTKGLERTVFPNPDSPLNPGKVGFKPGQHWMTLDVGEFFYSETARSPYSDEGAGSLCYVDSGSRRTKTSFPKGDQGLFTSPCDSGA